MNRGSLECGDYLRDDFADAGPHWNHSVGRLESLKFKDVKTTLIAKTNENELLSTVQSLSKFGFQLLESFLEYFREAVFDQINLIHVYIQCFGDLGGFDLLDGLEIEDLVVLRAGLLFHFLQGGVHDVLFPFIVPDGL